MKISIIIIIYNTKELIQKTLDKLKEADQNIKLEVIFIDNNSTDGSKEYLRELSGRDSALRVILNENNLGFAKAVNQGVKASTGKYILLLNSDAFIGQKQIARLVNILETKKNIGIVAPKLKNIDGSVQPSFGNFPGIFTSILYLTRLDKILSWGMVVYKKESGRILSRDWVSGACMLMRKTVFDRVGLFDENYFMGIEDIDFCYRARQAGLGILYVSEVSVLHYHQYTSKKIHKKALIIDTENRSLKYFYKKFYPKARLRYYLFSGLIGLKKNIQRLKSWGESKFEIYDLRFKNKWNP